MSDRNAPINASSLGTRRPFAGSTFFGSLLCKKALSSPNPSIAVSPSLLRHRDCKGGCSDKTASGSVTTESRGQETETPHNLMTQSPHKRGLHTAGV